MIQEQPGDVKGALELLRGRIHTNSKCGERDDNAHLALAIEGGGMRGVALAGMLLALEESGGLQAFDSIHGASVGGHLAVYFATGQARVALEIFSDQALDNRFISVTHLLQGRPLMDLDWMVDEVFLNSRRMYLESLSDDCRSVWLTCTDATTGQPVFMTADSDEERMRHVLKATAMIPYVAGKWIDFDGRLLIDGGITQPIPLRSAGLLGATHVVALSSYPRHRDGGLRDRVQHFVESAALRTRYGVAVARAFGATHPVDPSTLNVAEYQLDIINLPKDVSSIGWLMKDAKRLTALADRCYSATHEILASD